MMERGVRRKSHAPCEAGEKVAITSKSYLSLSERMEKNNAKVEPIDTMPEPEKKPKHKDRGDAR